MQRILVVEDEPQITQFLKRGLIFKGFEVIVACNGKQALHAIQDYSPDLIVLDVMLPDIDGCEVCRRLRANGDKTLPVLMLTAKDDLSDKIVGLVTKPGAFYGNDWPGIHS